MFISTCITSLVCKGRERHLDGPFLHQRMMGKVWRWHFLFQVRDPWSEGYLHVSRSMLVNVPGCQLGTALLFFNKCHQSSSYTELWKVSQRPHCVPLAAGAAALIWIVTWLVFPPLFLRSELGLCQSVGVTSFRPWRTVALSPLK